MGLLTEGSPLSWEDTKSLADHVRKHGIIQFINLYHRLKDRKRDILSWGDEVEFMLVKFDHEKKTVHVNLRGTEIVHTLLNKPTDKSLWRPEYAAYMLEGIPSKPYGALAAHFNIVESNMRYRREVINQLLGPDEVVLTLCNFPRLGCPNFTYPKAVPNPQDGVTRSLFFPDEAIFPDHPRFKTLTRNIRERRGEKVVINVPIYKDKNTRSPFLEDFSMYGDEGEARAASLPDHVYMDAMGFGMGCCCVQVTFQACDVDEARTLYDQLAPFCPIMLAITAAAPFYRGYITDVDCRWGVISCSVDCRTKEERGELPLKSDKFLIPKSRYSSIDVYISEESNKYNDTKVIYDEKIYEELRNGGIDHYLAQHIAHLFIRDTISLFSEKVDQDDENDSDHFENIQSTNWQSMRFKPPPVNEPTIGWRVEFRPCDIQFTDFENAAMVSFIVLVTRAILSYHLDFLIPISKIEENMVRAQRRDAILREKFWFRSCITKSTSSPEILSAYSKESLSSSSPYIEMTINEIVNGKKGIFPGLVPLVYNYLNSMDIDTDAHCSIRRYLKLLENRASGETMTPARWMREYVEKHPDYKKDSIITEEINYDLLKAISNIGSGEEDCPQLFGNYVFSTSRSSDEVPHAILCDDVSAQNSSKSK